MRLRPASYLLLALAACLGGVASARQSSAPRRSLVVDFCASLVPATRDWSVCNDKQIVLDGLHAVDDEKLIERRLNPDNASPALASGMADSYSAWKAATEAACSYTALDQPHWYRCNTITGRQYLSFLEWAYAPLLSDQTEAGNILDPAIAATGCHQAGLPRPLCLKRGLDVADAQLRDIMDLAAPPPDLAPKWAAYTSAACGNLAALAGTGRGSFPGADLCREVLTRQLAELVYLAYAE